MLSFIDGSLSVPVVVLGLVPYLVGFKQVTSDVFIYFIDPYPSN